MSFLARRSCNCYLVYLDISGDFINCLSKTGAPSEEKVISLENQFWPQLLGPACIPVTAKFNHFLWPFSQTGWNLSNIRQKESCSQDVQNIGATPTKLIPKGIGSSYILC